MTQEQNTCIILFAKFPDKGMAKTRLQPALGIDGAAKMAKQLLMVGYPSLIVLLPKACQKWVGIL